MYYIYIIFAVFISFNLKCQVNMNSDIKNLIDTSISISKEKGIAQIDKKELLNKD